MTNDIEQGLPPPEAKPSANDVVVGNGADAGHPKPTASSTTPSLTAENTDLDSDRSTLKFTEQPASHDDGRNHQQQEFFQFHRSKWTLTAVVFIVGSAACAAFLAAGINIVRNESQTAFQREASELAQAIETAMRNYELFALWTHQACSKKKQPVPSETIRPEDGIAEYLGICSREEFRQVYEHIDTVGLVFNSIQVLPNITDDIREEYERQQRAFYQENFPNLQYQGIAHVVVKDGKPSFEPIPQQPFYFPVAYAEPLEANLVAVDLDTHNTAFADLIDKVSSTTKPALSQGFRLLNVPTPHSYGIVLQHPGIHPHTTMESSRTNVIAQAVIRIPEFLELACEALKVPQSIYLYDGTPSLPHPSFLGGIQVNGDNRTILPEVSLDNIPRPSRSQYHETSFNITDREWIVAVVSDADEYTADVKFVVVGAVVLCVCMLLVIVWIQSSFNREARMGEIRIHAEQEKAAIAQRQIDSEKQLNEYIAHEVRNPLSAAISAISFVKTDALTKVPSKKDQEQMLKDIEIASSSLHFINDLLRNMLDVHRATKKQIKLSLGPTDVTNDILQPVASILFMRNSKAEIRIVCPPELFVNSDRMRLKQIVTNLAMNSVKFVEKGFICLRGAIVDGMVEISVEDSGKGVPVDKRDRLFEQYQESLDSLNQGTGIGLSLCKKLCDHLSAKIYLDDSFDSGVPDMPGARFVVALQQPPLDVGQVLKERNDSDEAFKIADAPTTSRTAQTNGLSEEFPPFPESLTVLFVDDDPMLRKMFTRSLERVVPKSWTIQKAANGETALRMVESQQFDVIFMDQYLASIEKQMLGTETVRALRSKGVTSIICGLSANEMEKQFIEAGANAFMNKPFPCEQAALRKEMHRILDSGETRKTV